ncbi:SUKH-3 domain-containing protein [Actinoplanes sp. NEAU-A12]|uniref:SUKH-3 domain-containing protein n=1 Tax=Actinoplanes sandaracinus TaxID=3045177 RepID=A0ABT6WBH7_9ACTN|nr:SUKH-3 domain-containing protein [Actinoplanes sandaracinus]MDI6097068.1 SUKH-3 domain-containing protein [Actinoplanes sandaracinus]
MITRTEAEHIATGWAHRQSIRRGYTCRPFVEELALGFAVSMMLPPGVRTEPGADVTTVIDRETGRLSHWPPAPSAELDPRYTERRDTAVGTHQTSDPMAELRREAHRRVSPSVAAHLTLGGRLFRARGAKGDQEVRHHPLIARRLAAIPPEHTVRGAERHAELLVVSDVLYEADKARDAPITDEQARVLLAQGRFETFHIRESGDPLAGRPATPCVTCSGVLLDLAAVTDRDLAHPKVQRVSSGTDPQPGRFPAEVAWELAAAGWGSDRERRARWGAGAVERIELSRGGEFAVRRFPAAEAAFAEFYEVTPSRNGPGAAQRVRWFQLGSGGLMHLADPLHELGAVVGARMFPLGREGFTEAVLAIDERGRVFSLDQGGEWFIAETLDQALVALITGLPAARIRDDGTW